MRQLIRNTSTFLILALSTAPAQVVTRLGPNINGVNEFDLTGMAGRPLRLPLVVVNRGSVPLSIGNVLPSGSISCPMFKVFDKAGGAPQVFNLAIVNCLMGKSVTLAPQQRQVFYVDVPFKLPAGEYTAVVTVPTLPRATIAKANLRIGPGPFIAELRFSPVIKANKPHMLEVVFTNVWRSTAQDMLLLCHDTGLLVRRADGTVVVNEADRVCADVLDGARLPPGGQTTRKQHLPPLPAGEYTAILWGKWNASATFQVKP